MSPAHTKILLVSGIFLMVALTLRKTPTGTLIITKVTSAINSAVWSIDPRGNQYDAQFTATELKYGLPKGLLRRMAYQESRFNPAAKSPVGASGLMQFMPATAAAYGFDPLNAVYSIEYAGQMMHGLYKTFGQWGLALAGYNWGSGNVAKFLAGTKTMPAETIAYMKQATDVGVV